MIRLQTSPKRAHKLVTRRELAQALGVHPITVTKWERDGMPVAQGGRRGVPSLYDLDLVRVWREARNGHGPGEADERLNLEQERARRERAQARLAEQMFLVREGKLLSRDDVERAWGQHVAAVRAKLLALPAVLADKAYRAAQQNGVTAVEQALTEAIRDVLRELAEGQ